MTDKAPAISEDDIGRQYKKFKASPKFDLNSEELYCICRQPDHGGKLMVLCSGCDEWYHFQCMKLPIAWSKLISEFYCLFCEWRGLGVTKWKKKCRLAKCLEPIRADSKYCSDEHGLEYMRSLLVKQKNVKDLKQVVSHVKDFDQFILLGDEFPELPSVVDFMKSGLTTSFPQDVQKDLQSVNNSLEEILKQTEKYTSRSEYLLGLKESLKQTNEKLLLSLGLSAEKSKSKKKDKKKKLDICFYDKSMVTTHHHTIDRVDFDELSSACRAKHIDEDFEDNTFGTICIRDKKKCVRHNGWWNLATDECSRKLVELAVESDKLVAKKEEVLREYSVAVYEV